MYEQLDSIIVFTVKEVWLDYIDKNKTDKQFLVTWLYTFLALSKYPRYI